MIISDSLEEAIEVMEKGGVIIYPTDTVLGLGADAGNKLAVEKVYRIKHRPSSRPIPIIIANLDQAKSLAYISRQQEKILNAVWPGAITVVLGRKGGGSIGLRIPDHPVPQELAKKFPVTGTSANLTGQNPCCYLHEAQAQFYQQHPQPDLLLNMPAKNKKQPSTVLDLTGSAPKILRIGACSPRQLLELLKI